MIFEKRQKRKDLTLEAYETTVPISVDGVLEEKEWLNSDSIGFNDNGSFQNRRSATVHVLWDKRYLYIAFNVNRKNPKAKVTQRDGYGLWFDDGIEFLIDPLNDKGKYFMPDDIAYHVNILNAVYDDRGTGCENPDSTWNGKALHEVRLKKGKHSFTGYICEAAVPWTELGITPVADKTVMGGEPFL